MVVSTQSPSNPRRTWSLLVVLALSATALSGCLGGDGGNGGGGGQEEIYGLTSGSSTGVYFAISNGIAAAVDNATDPGFGLQVSTSQGSKQNAERLEAGEFEFATMQNDVTLFAVNGQSPFTTELSSIQAIASLYPEMIQLVVLKDSDILTVQDLEGKRVVLGAPGSGAAVNAGQVLNASSVQANTQYLDLSTAAEQLKDGGVDAVFWTGGVPTGAIVSLATTHPVRMVPIDGETKSNLQRDHPFYADATLPANTYNGVDSDVPTVAVMAILNARSDVPNEHVQELLRILFESGDVQRAHSQAQNIRLENAFVGLSGIPLHDGARAYYEAQGVTIPE